MVDMLDNSSIIPWRQFWVEKG